MKFRDIAACLVIVSALEAYLIIQLAPQLRPTGGLGRLGNRLFILNILLYGFWATLIYPSFFSPLRHIPGPKKNANFLFGHARQARLVTPRGSVMRKWMEEIPNDGLLRFGDLLNQDALMPTSHAMLKAIVSDNNYDYAKQERLVAILRTILGDGLILVEGNVHKFQRKHLTPSFQAKVIRELYPTFWNKACELTHMLGEHVDEAEIEFGVWCTRVTLDIIGIAGFGRDFNSLKNPNDEFVADYQAVLEPHGQKVLFFVLNLIFPYWLVSQIPFWVIPKELKRISSALYQFGYNLSKERRAELSDPKTSTIEKDKRHDILSLLVKSNDFTDHELAHQVLTMMAAGHETTSSTLSWCIFLLAQHPEIQTQLREEIRSTLPSPSTHETVDASTIDALPLLNAVCNETLRLYPTVPVTTREVVNPTQLGPYTVPVGTNIFIVPWAINRCSKFWGENGDEFVPSRWIDVDPDNDKVRRLNNTGGATSNYSLMTFLHGPRSCIGQAFARSELKHLLAALVGRYEFSLTRDLKTYYPAGLVTTKPAEGMWVKLKEVEGW